MLATKKSFLELSGLANLLYQEGYLDKSSMGEAVYQAERAGLVLTTYLVRKKLITSSNILSCCIKYFNLPVFDLHYYNTCFLRDTSLTLEMMHRYHFLPFKKQSHFIEIGVANPIDERLSAVGFHVGLPVRLILVAEDLLDELIQKYCIPNQLSLQIQATLSQLSQQETEIATQEEQNDDEPVIQLVDRLIQEAINKKVSDIHIEPQASDVRIRFRHDGLLYEATTLPSHLAYRITTRLKIMANLNIAEKRLPQDGHIKYTQQANVEIRINTCPILFGEKIALRLPTLTPYQNINDLGFIKDQYNLFIEALSKPQGLILITGPTGSGKTLTLYAALHFLNKVDKNIITIEDPVEIACSGLNQINVNSRIGIQFSSILRTILRQDPDIIMIGEIRDTETAKMAMHAAETGHLVLSTLHTNNALEAIFRLQSLGISISSLARSLSLVIAQRLVRISCKKCIKNPTFNSSKCPHCYQGYTGRVGIFECISMNPLLAQQLSENHPIHIIETGLKSQGFLSLREAGLEKIKLGITDYAELLRVIGNGNISQSDTSSG